MSYTNSIYSNENSLNYFTEIAATQLEAKEYFTQDLILSVERNFNHGNVHIAYYDLDNNFLSWRTDSKLLLNNENHPYKKLISSNPIRKQIYRDAVKNNLTYFNVEPWLYKSTDIIAKNYDDSEYVSLIEKYFGAHYSLTMAFGLNAYIEMIFFKTCDEGDFTEEEMALLKEIYIFTATSYKTFKKHEQSKLISAIQNKVITSDENAYIVTDDFHHILYYNNRALLYLKDILGDTIKDKLSYENTNYWLNLILGADSTSGLETEIVRHIKDYILKVHIHDMHYSNTIVDRYYWITISRKDSKKPITYNKNNTQLTKTELKIANLLCEGNTYNEIATIQVISYHTVKKHVQNIYTKCNVTSRFELYKYLTEMNEAE